MITKAIGEAYQMKKERGWETLYFAIDLHGTIIRPGRDIGIEVYGDAEDALRYLSQQKDIVLILYTATKAKALVPFLSWCAEHSVKFKYVNENPECGNLHDGDYSKKMYFNFLADDRSGFDPHVDWVVVKHAVETNIEKEKAEKVNPYENCSLCPAKSADCAHGNLRGSTSCYENRERNT